MNILWGKKKSSVFLVAKDYEYRDWLKFDLG